VNRLARDKHSSLFVQRVSEEGKKVLSLVCVGDSHCLVSAGFALGAQSHKTLFIVFFNF
jgi:hypothetical protein